MNKHKLAQYQRQIESLEKKKEKLKKELATQAEVKAHYNVKNVKKREERNSRVQKALREELAKYKLLARKRETECEIMKRQLEEFKKSSKRIRNMIKSRNKRMKQLMKENRNARKRARFHKLRNLRKRRDEKEVANTGQRSFKEKEALIETKDRHGEYKDRTRFCVMELAGLEVATGKIGEVMETVGTTSGVKFSSLPSRFACQSIIDEGQVLAKRYIRESVLERAKSFGLHIDGTTRRKVKILDTSIRTDEGDSFCFGWSSLVSETGQAIAEEAKEKLEEVAVGSGQAMTDIWRKLEYFMNDRAANEKKSK